MRVRRSARLWPIWSLLAFALAALWIFPAPAQALKLTGAKTGSTLTLGYPSAPTTLEPAKYGASDYWQADLAYDSLVEDSPNGVLKPGLATSWKYVGDKNEILDMTLRSGVRFSDGATMTAEGVKSSLDYYIQNSGSSDYTGFQVTVTGPLSIRITSPTPNPIMPKIFDQDDYGAGRIVGPKGLADPKSLGTSTDGAGPYELQPSNTVTGDHYTFVQNPYYWNKSAQHYKTVVVKVITNQNTMLQAMQSGEIDAAKADLTTAQSAKAAGLQVKSPLGIWVGLELWDRGGQMLPALGDIRVRQALNYAIDRKAITKAELSGYGRPSDVISTPADDGWVSKQMYSYNPTKARRLLKAAGYGAGLTIPVAVTPYLGDDTLVEAMAGYLSKVGVTLKLTDLPMTQFTTNLTDPKYPAAGGYFGIKDVFAECTEWICPTGGWNPFHSSDPQIEQLMTQLAVTPSGPKSAAIAKEINQRIVSLAWEDPVAVAPEFYYARSTVNVSMINVKNYYPDPVWFTPKGNAS